MEQAEPKKLVIGIDFGSADSYVGYITKGTVDIVQNEVSQRKTPSLVGFTERQRLLGDAALSLFKSNAKNSCRNFKHLIGQYPSSEAVETERFWSTCPLVDDSDGFTGCSVNYKGEPRTFSMQAITAMFLTKLKTITEAWTSGEVADVVIGVPPYFSDVHRNALLDACKIANINVLRLMNEHTATALEYGYFRSADFDMEKPFTVAFCSMGHAVFSVAIVQFIRGKLTVLCERSAKVGGRDMDECLMRVFAEQFKKKTGCDVLSNKKAMIKLEDAVSKTKKILSANSEASISCECLMEDEDFSSNIARSDFLNMCQPMMKRVSDVLQAAKENCGLPESAIDAVEMCGGSSRVPWVKELCSKAFGGKDLSTTMNQDECVARGCTLQAAILSSLYRARPFTVEDTNSHPISLGWSCIPPAVAGGDSSERPTPQERTAIVFPQGSPVNVLKVLTFYRKESFKLRAFYEEVSEQQPSTTRDIATYTVELPTSDVPRKVKVKVALTIHGTFKFEGAHVVEEEATQHGEANTANENGNAMAADGGASDSEALKRTTSVASAADETLPRTLSAGGEAASVPEDGQEPTPGSKRPAKRPEASTADVATRPAKVRKKAKTSSLNCLTEGALCLASAALAQRSEAEEAMRSESREIEETDARKNDLEAYIFSMRSNICEGAKYGPYITAEDRDKFLPQLDKAEEWLYDHADDAKHVFVEKLAELKVLGGPAEARYQEDLKRPDLISRLEEAVRSCREHSQQPGLKQPDLDNAAAAASRWLVEFKRKQAALPKYEDPVLRCDQLESKSAELEKLLEDARRQERTNGGTSDAPPPSPLVEVS